MTLSHFSDLPDKMAAHHAWEQLLTVGSQTLALLETDSGGRDWCVDLHTGRQGGRAAVVDALRQWSYEPDQMPRESRRFIGLFAITPAQAEAIDTLNAAKTVFAQAIARVRGDDTEALLPELTRALGAARKLRQSLTSMGQPRVHLLQATRQIPVLPPQTHSVGFTWARGSKSTVVVELDEAIAAIEKRCADNPERRAADCQALTNAVAAGFELRKARTTSAHLRANVAYGAGQKKQMTASLPFAVIIDHQSTWPRHAEPASIPVAPPISAGRLQRTDVRIHPEPLTASAPFYAAEPAQSSAA